MEYIVRYTTGGVCISYGYWLAAAWKEVYAIYYPC